MNDDDWLQEHAKIYRAEVKKLQEENEQKQVQLQNWEADQGLKPTAKDFEQMMGGPKKTEAEISAEAWKVADQKMKEQDLLEKGGLIDPPTRSQAEDLFGNNQEELRKLAEEQERQRKLEQEREMQRKQGGEGRSM